MNKRLYNKDKNKNFYYQVHRKKFIIPYYFSSFVQTNKLPIENGMYKVKIDKNIKEMGERKLNYNEHYLDILSYLANRDDELNNF